MIIASISIFTLLKNVIISIILLRFMRKSLKAVIFDYGNVLSFPPLPENFRRMQEICNLPLTSFEKVYRKYRTDFDRGVIDGKIYWSRILKAGNIEPDEEKIQILIREDINAWTRIDYRIVQWARRIGESGYKTAILSNMPGDILVHIKKMFSWIADFNVHAFSCDLGFVKPGLPIYRYCLQKLKIQPKESLFIDDSYENIAAAKQLGMNALVYRSLEEALNKLKVIYELPDIG